MEKIKIITLVLSWAIIHSICYSEVKVHEYSNETVKIETGDYLFCYIKEHEHATLGLKISSNSISTNFVSGKDFELLNNVKKIHCKDSKELITVLLSGKNNWAKFNIFIEFRKSLPGLIHYYVNLKTYKPKFVTSTHPECRFQSDISSEVAANLQDLFTTYPYLAQTSVYAPFAYFNDPVVTKSTIFYYSNYTSMNDYYKFLAVEPLDAVSKFSNTSFGYTPPVSNSFQIPAGVELTIVDSYLHLKPKLESDIDRCKNFVECYAVIYDLIDKPDTEFADFRQIGINTLKSLQDPQCLSNYYAQQLLRAYVNAPESHTGLCTNLMVLTPFQEFHKIFGEGTDFKNSLEKAVDMFYVPELKTIFNRVVTERPDQITTHPASSWYYTFDLLQLGQIGQYGNNPRIKEIFLETMPYLMRFSRSVNYEFPIFADYMTLEIDDPRLQGDMPGCYAYTMLIAYELTGNKEYLEEAKKSVEHFVGKGFKVGYEMHITASGIAACGWLYEITGDQHYLDIAYIPLANLLRDTWLWESDLGYAYGYRTFNNIAAQRGCPVVGPVEQNEAWAYLREYYLKANKGFPVFLKRLIPEYMKQIMASAYYSYPQTLPAEAMHPGPPYAPADKKLWIGLEGIRPGALKSGSIGQAIYMSGGAFRYAGFSYHQPIVKGTSNKVKDVVIYCEYPLLKCKWDSDKKQLEIETSGDDLYDCRMRVYFDMNKYDFSGYAFKTSCETASVKIDKDSFMNYIEYIAKGGTEYIFKASQEMENKSDFEIQNAKVNEKQVKTTYLPQRKACIAPGGTYEYTLIFENPNDAPASLKIDAKLPKNWSVINPLKQIVLKPGMNKTPLRIQSNLDAKPSDYLIEIIAEIDSRTQPLVSQVFTVLSPTIKSGQDLSDINDWVSVSPSLISREVIVDLDKTPFLYADMTEMQGGYTLFVSDDYTYRIRVISDTTHKGKYKCDLQEMTGWQGVHKFNFLLFSFATKEKPVLKKFELR